MIGNNTSGESTPIAKPIKNEELILSFIVPMIEND